MIVRPHRWRDRYEQEASVRQGKSSDNSGDGTTGVICARHLVSVTQAYGWFVRFKEEDAGPVKNVISCLIMALLAYLL